ncbi:hypothetical protein Htur_1104 [Haloterrigena turkmenica DSM 5511]|uniref:STAS/SEC14 domain-containing protein n=1 Tax=Haloterrigena turkmenica (strain ATCC 51198 / DSM 5511 / JCM 9101 / NCIMB 13204 / VKM B-1734 / 4k) TaxID=543526 RepID=D2RZ72_HALTV|nr:hypothetical protein [Haloterrigena turkmenica]ADB59996.1 hypothetical protein Htur_1104 [Haloterrigena turkmenica DSM 5511]
MTTEIVERTDDYTVELESELGIPVFTYERFVTGEELREAALRWAEIIEAEDIDRYVVNTAAFMAHRDEDKQWLAETWIPKLLDLGVRAGAGVHSDSAVSSLEMGRVETKLNEIDPEFEYRTFTSDADALEWIAEQ